MVVSAASSGSGPPAAKRQTSQGSLALGFFGRERQAHARPALGIARQRSRPCDADPHGRHEAGGGAGTHGHLVAIGRAGATREVAGQDDETEETDGPHRESLA